MDQLRPPVVNPTVGDDERDDGELDRDLTTRERELPEHEIDRDRTTGAGDLQVGGTAIDRGTGTMDGQAQGQPRDEDPEEEPLNETDEFGGVVPPPQR